MWKILALVATALILSSLIDINSGESPSIAELADASPRRAQERKDQELAWYQRMIVDAYMQHGQHNVRWDTEAQRFLQDWAKQCAEAAPDLETGERVRLARRLYDELNCTDPLVIYVAARTYEDIGDQARKSACDRDSSRTFRTSAYQWHHRFSSVYHEAFNEYADRKPVTPRTHELLGKMQETLRTAWNAGEYADQPSILLKALSIEPFYEPARNDLWQPLVHQLAQENSTTWVGQYVLGKLAIREAFRQCGFRAPTPQILKSKRFIEVINLAENHFKQVVELAPKEPYGYLGLFHAGIFRGDAALIERRYRSALSVEFDYLPIHKLYIDSHAPRWGGSPAAMATAAHRTSEFHKKNLDMRELLALTMFNAYYQAETDEDTSALTALYTQDKLFNAHLRDSLEAFLTNPRNAMSQVSFRHLRITINWHDNKLAEAAVEARALGRYLDHEQLARFGVDVTKVLAHTQQTPPTPPSDF